MSKGTADKIFLNVGTHAAIPSIPGLAEARRAMERVRSSAKESAPM
jgi:hypothetical protein